MSYLFRHDALFDSLNPQVTTHGLFVHRPSSPMKQSESVKGNTRISNRDTLDYSTGHGAAWLSSDKVMSETAYRRSLNNHKPEFQSQKLETSAFQSIHDHATILAQSRKWESDEEAGYKILTDHQATRTMVQPIASSQSQIVDSASDDTYDPAETNGRKNSKSSSASSSSTSMDEEKKSRNLYKTELCRNWREKGQCKYGPRCQYAHGPGDLRKVERHPKYKTQLCRTFQQTGSCPYGGRCMFKHQEETSIAKSPVLCHKTNSVNRQMTTPSPVSENSMSNSDTEEDEDDMLMLPNPESLLPQQLLTEIENEPTTSTARVCPLRQYVDISALSKMTHPLLPSYNPHTSSSVATVERCRAFLSPWLL